MAFQLSKENRKILFAVGVLLLVFGLIQIGYTAYTAAITITVDNTPPTASITSPENGQTITVETLPTQITVSFSVTDNIGVQTYTATLDGTTIASGTYGAIGTTIVTKSVPATVSSTGTHTVKVTVSDFAGNTASDTVTFTATQYITPEVTIVSPTNGSVIKGTVTITVQATPPEYVDTMTLKIYDEVGSLINSITMSQTGANAWGAQWDTTTVPDGTYILKAEVKTKGVGEVIVYDLITVEVDNVEEAPSIPFIEYWGAIPIVVGGAVTAVSLYPKPEEVFR